MSRLLLIDLSNLTHRSIHGYPPLSDSSGRPTHGAHGAGAITLKMIGAHRPTHLVAACDSPRADLVRRTIYAPYKAHRVDADDSVSHQLALAEKVLAALGARLERCAGWEADDVIATLARRWEGDEVVICSGDKDLLALVDERTRVHLLGRDVFVNPQICQDLTGLDPRQMTDYKALVGDSSDGFPGVPGIGDKGAKALLSLYGDLDGVIAAFARGELTGRAASAMAAGEQMGRVSYQLARMREDLDLDLRPAPWSFSAESADALDRLEMRSLADRVRREI
ncbi:5'-3' exonuclease [Miltoncostaea oceani]|uniref:5'-3' exonuclease n=1 Tax=Miltoncostaea oceani TaxID=2843216 RepID=UPI001C3D8160|nr:5'-3' exonuclease H3TH domain-containing protein [Miltoncostaea oceani]